MLVGFGEFAKATVDAVMLDAPSYVLWMLTVPNPYGPLLAARAEAERLIETFDAMPFSISCEVCDNVATGCFARFRYNNLELSWRCDVDHCESVRDAVPVSTYMNAAYFARMVERSHLKLDRQIVAELARAKEIPYEDVISGREYLDPVPEFGHF